MQESSYSVGEVNVLCIFQSFGELVSECDELKINSSSVFSQPANKYSTCQPLEYTPCQEPLEYTPYQGGP